MVNTKNPFDSGLRILVLTILAPLFFVLVQTALLTWTNSGVVDFAPDGTQILTVSH